MLITNTISARIIADAMRRWRAETGRSWPTSSSSKAPFKDENLIRVTTDIAWQQGHFAFIISCLLAARQVGIFSPGHFRSFTYYVCGMPLVETLPGAKGIAVDAMENLSKRSNGTYSLAGRGVGPIQLTDVYGKQHADVLTMRAILFDEPLIDTSKLPTLEKVESLASSMDAYARAVVAYYVWKVWGAPSDLYRSSAKGTSKKFFSPAFKKIAGAASAEAYFKDFLRKHNAMYHPRSQDAHWRGCYETGWTWGKALGDALFSIVGKELNVSDYGASLQDVSPSAPIGIPRPPKTGVLPSPIKEYPRPPAPSALGSDASILPADGEDASSVTLTPRK